MVLSSQVYRSAIDINMPRNRLIDCCHDRGSHLDAVCMFIGHLRFAGITDRRYKGYRYRDKFPVGAAMELRAKLVMYKNMQWEDAKNVHFDEAYPLMFGESCSFYVHRLTLERCTVKRAAQDLITLTCDAALFVRLKFQASDFEDGAKLDILRQFMKNNNFCAPTANTVSISEDDITNDEPPDQTVIVDVPSLIIMNEINTTGFNGFDLCSMAIASAATFLLSLGVSEHPVFGLVVDGPLCTLLCAEHRREVSAPQNQIVTEINLLQTRFVCLTAYDVITYNVANKYEEAELLKFLSDMRNLSSQRHLDLHAAIKEFVKSAEVEKFQKGWTAAAQQVIMEEVKSIVKARWAAIGENDSDSNDAYEEDNEDEDDGDEVEVEVAGGMYTNCRIIEWADFGSEISEDDVDNEDNEDDEDDEDDDDEDDEDEDDSDHSNDNDDDNDDENEDDNDQDDNDGGIEVDNDGSDDDNANDDDDAGNIGRSGLK